MQIDKESEKNFGQWLESIRFVDRTGEVLPIVLTKDKSEDPENDRGEE